ncbi:hypothetical protein ACH4PR_25265 [Streptomyces mirabilis]|uniref:hypothetical protein n=1 Tax=Streptomyces mirabilis TaxID=68239 RepID=UPI0037872828
MIALVTLTVTRLRVPDGPLPTVSVHTHPLKNTLSPGEIFVPSDAADVHEAARARLTHQDDPAELDVL